MLKIPKDKAGHFLVGAGISLVVGGLVNQDTGLIAATVAGIAKEVVWDKFSRYFGAYGCYDHSRRG